MSGVGQDVYYWVSEYITDQDVYQHGLEEIYISGKTNYQDMAIVRSGTFGKALVLDGKWQSCTGDEFLYHEPIVHLPSIVHGAPKKVLILGGGEGATVREALKWKSVEHVRMVDIDGEVVEACIEHLPEMHQGAFDDPRTDLVIGDALDCLDASEGEWDIIISDLSDPIEEGPSFPLFTREFFEKCHRALAPGGAFVIQGGTISPYGVRIHARLMKTLQSVFEHTANYTSPTVTYGSTWGFAMGAKKPIETRPDPDAIDALIATMIKGDLRMFDGTAMLGMMQTPKYVRDLIAEETEIYTMAHPPKFKGKGIIGTA